MKTSAKTKILAIIIFLLAFWLPIAIFADDVLPAVSQDEMSQYQDAFGKAISASHSDPDHGRAGQHPTHPDNFGGEVSAAAHQLKVEGDKDGFGKWVSDQRRHSTDDQGDQDSQDSDSDRDGGRGHHYDKGDSHGDKGGNGKGGGGH
jgi:hypothetical protein